MGKCTRKAKTTGDVPLAEVSQSSLGVRTRAKTLALQRLQSSTVDSEKADYLELRSRRLEKPPLVKNSAKTPLLKQGCACTEKENNPGKTTSGSGHKIGGFKNDNSDSEIEASFGENNLDLEVKGRSTRESTPNSLIRTSDTMTPPGSSTKPRNTPIDPIERAQDTILRNIPTPRDMEEFFANEEQAQQREFTQKYNFDVVNDVPLPGRYEWVKVMP